MYQPHVNAALAAWNEGNLDGLDQYFDQNCARIAPKALDSNTNNLTELKEVITEFRTAYPDCQVVLSEAHYQDNSCTLLWTWTGTNTGPGEFPPTGKSVNVNGCTLVRFRDGKVIEELVYFDAFEMLNQLGFVEMPEMA